MHYSMYVDESGQFLEQDGAIVAGFIMRSDMEAVRGHLEKEVKSLNARYLTNFDIMEDMHIAAVMMPEKAPKLDEKERFINIPKEAREAFAGKCLDVMLKYADKIVYAVNSNRSGIDEQGRYGDCLNSVVQNAVNFLRKSNDVEKFDIFISGRHGKCLIGREDEWYAYHRKICDCLKSRYGKDLGNNVLHIDIASGRRNLFGADMADVVCYFTRFQKDLLPPAMLIKSSLAASANGELVNAVFQKMIEDKEYLLVYSLGKSTELRKKLLAAISNISDPVILGKNLVAFMNTAYELVDKRTLQPDALDEAMKIFNLIEEISKREFEKDRKNRNFFECLLAGIDGKITCLNHQGGKGSQASLEDEYRRLVKEYPMLISSSLERGERTLKLRNRAYNNEFNNYEFERIIQEFFKEVDSRILEYKDEPDELTGEMCGTLGQAHSFLARTDTPDIHYFEAEKYFNESLKHFNPGYKYHKMSVNYLVTLFWDKKEYEKATDAFFMHSDVPKLGRAEDYIRNILSPPEAYDMSTAFDLSILMRIAVEQGTIESSAFEAVKKFLDEHKVDDHPYELLCKWMGISCLKAGDYKTSLSYLDESIRIADKLEFTVKTITLSSVGLRLIAYSKMNDMANAGLERVALVARIQELKEISSQFALYIGKIGGEEKMLNDVAAGDITNVSRWLPFAYA